jgi:hypothetical protein
MGRPLDPQEDLRIAVNAVLQSEVAAWRPVSGGFSSAGLWVITTASGSSYFVKAATTDDTARFLRAEASVYEAVTAPFMPGIEAWVDDGNRPFLVMEDLSACHWPPPWQDGQIAAVLETCAEIGQSAVPSGFAGTIDGALRRHYWPELAAHPEPLYRLGVASGEWFEMAFPQLVSAESVAVVEGGSLVHGDMRSDNLCFGAEIVKVVDWNWAFVGNPDIDVVAWLPSLQLERGPPPWELKTGQAPLVARIAGFFLHHATMPPNPDVRGDLREFQRAQGSVALAWAAHELALPPPRGEA